MLVFRISMKAFFQKYLWNVESPKNKWVLSIFGRKNLQLEIYTMSVLSNVRCSIAVMICSQCCIYTITREADRMTSLWKKGSCGELWGSKRGLILILLFVFNPTLSVNPPWNVWGHQLHLLRYQSRMRMLMDFLSGSVSVPLWVTYQSC